MARLIEKIVETGNIKIHLIPTNKFKTITMALNFKSAFNDEKMITIRALLPYALMNFIPKNILEQRLDSLYGASLNSNLSMKGRKHIVNFSLSTINEQFIKPCEPVLKSSIKLFSEVILNPLKRKQFPQMALINAKQTLRQKLALDYEDKDYYGEQKIIDEMCKNEEFTLHAYGYINCINDINPDLMYQAYLFMLLEDQVDFYIVGEFKEENVIETIKDYFVIPESKKECKAEDKLGISFKVIKNVNFIEERQKDIKQGKLNIGFRTNITREDHLFHAYQVFNGIFGGFAHSKLVKNIRETAGLAYNISSEYDSYKGIIIVNCSIQPKDSKKAVGLITEQLEAIKNGEINSFEVKKTKELLKNIMITSLDDPFSIIDILYQNELSSRVETVEDWINKIDAVTSNDIIEAANDTLLDTIFLLRS